MVLGLCNYILLGKINEKGKQMDNIRIHLKYIK